MTTGVSALATASTASTTGGPKKPVKKQTSKQPVPVGQKSKAPEKATKQRKPDTAMNIITGLISPAMLIVNQFIGINTSDVKKYLEICAEANSKKAADETIAQAEMFRKIFGSGK